MSSKGFNRRQLLAAGSGAALGMVASNPFDALFQGIARRLITDAAYGQTGTEQNYICLMHSGAPPRWAFDAFLNPQNQAGDIIDNATVRNALSSGGVLQSIYTGNNADTAYVNAAPYTYTRDGVQKTIYLPLLADVTLPEWDGTNAVYNSTPPMVRDLLPNMMIVRGIDMGVDVGHVAGPPRIIRPNSGELSLSGVNADASGRMIPAMAYLEDPSQPNGFASAQSSMSVVTGATTTSAGPLSDLLSAFFIDTTKYPLISQHASNRAKMQAAVDSALNTMQQYAQSSNPGASKVYASFRNAQALFLQAVTDFGNLSSQFTALKNKYVALTKAARAPFAGLMPAMVDASSFSTPYATTLALAEYLIGKGLAASYTLSCGSSINVGNTLVGNTNISMIYDEHNTTDRQLSAICCNFLYRSMFACLNEFTKAIGTTAFANTAVHIGAEFGRCGHNDASGSDHAVTANAMTVLSGAITGFIPMGNIERTHYTTGTLVGTWGSNAPTGLATGGLIGITHENIASSVADLIGRTHPTRAASLLTKDTSGNWMGVTEDPKNV